MTARPRQRPLGERVAPAGAPAERLPAERLPDEALLAGLAAGDAALAADFVGRFAARVHGVALAVLRDPSAADDVAQQAFVQAWRHGATYDPRRGSVLTWIGAITRNLAIDANRVRRPEPVDVDALVAGIDACATSPEDRAVLGEAVAELRAALLDLPGEQARAVVLAGIVGLTAAQVAAVEGIPVGTAKTRIRAAMMKLRHALATSHD